MSRACGNIKSFADLNKESFQTMFRAHFDSQDLIISNVGSLGGGAGKPDGFNEYFSSDIRKVTVKYKIDENDEEERAAALVIKLPPSGLMKHMGKAWRQLRHEVVYYSR